MMEELQLREEVEAQSAAVQQVCHDNGALSVRLARDESYRAALRTRIATARVALYDDLAPVRALEAFLEGACRRGAEVP